MSHPWNNESLVAKTPVVYLVLLESANAHQLYQIWAANSSTGQSLLGWLGVTLALLIRWNFYRVVAPQQRVARACIVASLLLNLAIIWSVVVL